MSLFMFMPPYMQDAAYTHRPIEVLLCLILSLIHRASFDPFASSKLATSTGGLFAFSKLTSSTGGGLGACRDRMAYPQKCFQIGCRILPRTLLVAKECQYEKGCVGDTIKQAISQDCREPQFGHLRSKLLPISLQGYEQEHQCRRHTP